MFGLSLTSIADYHTRRAFTSAGLRPNNLTLDPSTTLRYWSSTPTTPPKPSLLLIHGFGPDCTWQWYLQVHPLSRHFHLIVPDLLFFGGSSTSSPHRSEAFQASCLQQLLNTLVLPEQKVSVVGTSYGGFVAYHVARMMGERVERVVIASSDLMKGEEDDVRLKERAGVETVADLMLPRTTGDMRKLLRLSMHRPPKFLPAFVIRDVMRKLSKGNLKEKMELMKGVTLGKRDQFQLTPLPQEVLIVWGEHDNIFPLEKAHAIKKQLGEKAKLEILKNTSHVPQSEDPVRFNDLILKFLLGGSKTSVTVHVKDQEFKKMLFQSATICVLLILSLLMFQQLTPSES